MASTDVDAPAAVGRDPGGDRRGGAGRAAEGQPGHPALRDDLGPVFDDADFADWFAAEGRAGLSPAMLALVMVLQHLENLTDRDAADAVRTRLDWKYALGLERFGHGDLVGAEPEEDRVAAAGECGRWSGR